MAASARIAYNGALVVGGKLVADAVKNLIAAREQLDRAVAVANAISGGGVTPTNLEGSPEFNVGAGQGAAFYTAISDTKTNLASIAATTLANLDPGG